MQTVVILERYPYESHLKTGQWNIVKEIYIKMHTEPIEACKHLPLFKYKAGIYTAPTPQTRNYPPRQAGAT